MHDNKPLSEKLEELFGKEPLAPVEEELFKWFLFAWNGKGSGIKNLKAVEFERFKNGLVRLAGVVYRGEQAVNKSSFGILSRRFCPRSLSTGASAEVISFLICQRLLSL